jgi:hypothetical protein
MTATGNPKPRAEVAGAGTFGGAVGLAIAGWANGLPPTSAAKPILNLAAPIVSVFVSWLFLHVKKVYIDPYVRKKELEVAERQLHESMAAANELLNKIKADPNSSAKTIADVQKNVDFLKKNATAEMFKKLALPSS